MVVRQMQCLQVCQLGKRLQCDRLDLIVAQIPEKIKNIEILKMCSAELSEDLQFSIHIQNHIFTNKLTFIQKKIIFLRQNHQNLWCETFIRIFSFLSQIN